MTDIKNAKVTLAALLQSREERAEYQKTLVSGFNLPLVSLTINFPGDVKCNDLTEFVFLEGVNAIREKLAGRLAYVKLKELATGFEGFFVADEQGLDLKAKMAQIEETHPLGRLLDIDVINCPFAHISRTRVGLGPRKCLVCEKEGHVCARAQSHTAQELKNAIENMVERYKINGISRN